MFARRLALAIAVLAELIGSQGPEFTQQYRQRLGGALEELNRIVAEFDAEAGRENLTRVRLWAGSSATTTLWPATAAKTCARRSIATGVSASRSRP